MKTRPLLHHSLPPPAGGGGRYRDIMLVAKGIRTGRDRKEVLYGRMMGGDIQILPLHLPLLVPRTPTIIDPQTPPD